MTVQTYSKEYVERLIDVYRAALAAYRELDGLGYESVYTLEDALTKVDAEQTNEHSD